MGDTALYHAAANGNVCIVDFPLENSADCTIQSGNDLHLIQLVDISSFEFLHGDATLHYTIEYRDSAKAELLLQLGTSQKLNKFPSLPTPLEIQDVLPDSSVTNSLAFFTYC